MDIPSDVSMDPMEKLNGHGHHKIKGHPFFNHSHQSPDFLRTSHIVPSLSPQISSPHPQQYILSAWKSPPPHILSTLPHFRLPQESKSPPPTSHQPYLTASQTSSL